MEIYAEISHRLLDKIKNKNYILEFPKEVKVNRKTNSRSLYLEFDDSIKDYVVDILDKNGITWQIL
jgi:peptidoglycan/xylan/chitin deacetylase (PgdA/CDA1 family)